MDRRDFQIAAAAGICLLLTVAQALSADFGQRSGNDACIVPADSQPDELIAACFKAINSHMLNRNGVALALTNLAVAYESKKDWNSALEALNAAIKLEGAKWPALVKSRKRLRQIGKERSGSR